MEEKVVCRTPTEGRDGVTNLPKWKFDAIRSAILSTLETGDIPFSQLKDAVNSRLTEDELAHLGSLGWHTTSVKLEMEVRGEIRRIDGPGPQMLTLAS